MSGLPLLPGFTFNDPTITRTHLSHTFDFRNAYAVPRVSAVGVGQRVRDVDSVEYLGKRDMVRYDPSLTYGRSRSVAQAQFLPHYALYDQKCLTFRAFYKQSVNESPNEFYRIRCVNLIYFLEDDTITVMEPKVENSGLDQGRLIRRNRIAKNSLGEAWSWKDLNIGKDYAFYGIVFHTVDCDKFTREYMSSQGIDIGEAEEMPVDPYTQQRIMQRQPMSTRTPPADDKLRRFLEYDGKILKFNAAWDDRDSEFGELRNYELLYFLADDTIAVKEIIVKNSGRDPVPLLLRKTKLPKIWTDRPVTYPAIYLEISDAEVTEYYQPKDLVVGETVFVLGRRMLLVDCDKFSRNYYRKVLCFEQPPGIDIKPKPKKMQERKMPPHDGIGSLEDSLQNTLTVLPKPPRKDVMRQILNANKFLRYEMKFDAVHPEDTIRRFILLYSLGDSTCSVYEPKIDNSGIVGGKYLRRTLIIKPGSDPLNPDYYSPNDFYIGAVINIFKQRFIITGADLYVYRYMQSNPEKFPCEVIDNVRNYMFLTGLLKEDLKEKVDENKEMSKKQERAAIGRDVEIKKTEMEKCMDAVKVGGENYDPENDARVKQKILHAYEDSWKERYEMPPPGIKPVNTTTCGYPVHIGDMPDLVCHEIDGPSIAPKHIDTVEEARKKYYDSILEKHKHVCETAPIPPCVDPPQIGEEHSHVDEACAPAACKNDVDKEGARPAPLMVQPVQYPKGACKVKSVRFAEGPARCERDRYDLCDLRTSKTHCGCTDYQKCEH